MAIKSQIETIKAQLAPQLKPLTDKYQSLPAKDQTAVKWLSLFLGVLFVYFYIFEPAAVYHDQAMLKQQKAAKDYAWLKAKEPQVRALKGQPSAQADRSKSLLSVINEVAKQAGLTVKRIQPEGNDKIRLWLEDADFNKLIQVLEQLQKQKGLMISEISTDKKVPGTVDARITIER